MTFPDSRFGSAAPRHPRWGVVAWVYAIAIVYVSTVLGPTGFNFVPRDPLAALHAFVTMPYYDHGSDQRQDWMANLMMFAGVGFLLAAARTGSRPTRAGPLIASFAIAVAFLLVVKYVQLFFPPRTVTINYVLAQTLGTIVGIAAFVLLRRRVEAVLHAVATGGRRMLRAALALYTAALLLFMVFPFDFTLSVDDFTERVAALPDLLLSWPGEGRPLFVRAFLMAASIGMTVPVGLWLRIARPHRSTASLFANGFLIIAAVMSIALFVISAAPQLITLCLRGLGVALGLALGRWLERGPLPRLKPALRIIALPLSIAYVVLVIVVKGVATTDLLSIDAALAQFDPHGLIPLWHHYIVSKSQAARSVLLHIAMFAPIGFFFWLIAGIGRTAAWSSGIFALIFCLAVEVLRGMQPNLQADLTNVMFAVVAAVTAHRLAPFFWDMLVDLGRRPGGVSATGTSDVDDEKSLPDEPQRASSRHGEFDQSEVPALTNTAARASAQPQPIDASPGIDPPPLSDPELEPARPPRRASVGHWIFAALALGAAGALIFFYPLSRPALALVATLTGVLLWLRPQAWPMVVPTLLCAIDFMPWSGWIYASESDVLIAVAIAVMAVRQPPALHDLRMARPAALTILAVVATGLIGLALGLTNNAGVFAHSANPYLHPNNAWRIGKGLLIAIALLPFLRTDWRREPRLQRRLAIGFAVALAFAALIAVAERLTFVEAFDFATEYRVVGPFTAMHLGGSQLAIFLVLALPFAIGALLRSRGLRAAALTVVIATGLFALAVTYTRAAYASILLGLVAFTVAAMMAQRARLRGAAATGLGARLSTGMIAATFAVLAGGVALGIVGAGYMSERLRTSSADLGLRLANWRDGLAMRDPGLLTTLFGMGSGSFPRINAARGQPAHVPTDYWLSRDDRGPVLSLRSGAVLYFGQKVALRADHDYRLTLRARAPDGATGLMASLCEKLVLYSTNCTGPAAAITVGTAWQQIDIPIGVHLLAGAASAWPLARPFEATLWTDKPGRRLDIADIALSDRGGRNLLVNGDFRDGMRFWAITDDYHWAWRIEGEYPAVLFDGGIAKLATLLLLLCVAFVGAVRMTLAGHSLGPALVAAALTTMAAGIFDQPFQTPRLAALLYLALFTAMLGFEPRRRNGVRPSEDIEIEAAIAHPAPMHPSPVRRRRRRRSHAAASDTPTRDDMSEATRR